jgi:signal peptidase I
MKNRSRKRWILIFSIVTVACILFVLAPFLLRTFIIQAYKIPSGAMKPTLLVGDHILVDKNATTLDKINRKDIVVFVYPENPSKDFVKRLVGLPGDTIEIQSKELFINGESFSENYTIHTDPNILPSDKYPRDNLGPIKVPPDHIFVMGDNRDQSFDSRFWGFVDISKIKGKVTKIYWSWDKENSQVRWGRIGETVH